MSEVAAPLQPLQPPPSKGLRFSRKKKKTGSTVPPPQDSPEPSTGGQEIKDPEQEEEEKSDIYREEETGTATKRGQSGWRRYVPGRKSLKKYKKYFQTTKISNRNKLQYKLIHFISFTFTLLMNLMSSLYLALNCKNPCTAKMLFLFNVSLMFSMFVYHLIYIFYVIIKGFKTNNGFWMSIIGTIVVAILGIMYLYTYNEKVSDSTAKIRQHKLRMRNINIASMIIIIPLMILYGYEMLFRKFDERKIE